MSLRQGLTSSVIQTTLILNDHEMGDLVAKETSELTMNYKQEVNMVNWAP